MTSKMRRNNAMDTCVHIQVIINSLLIFHYWFIVYFPHLLISLINIHLKLNLISVGRLPVLLVVTADEDSTENVITWQDSGGDEFANAAEWRAISEYSQFDYNHNTV